MDLTTLRRFCIQLNNVFGDLETNQTQIVHLYLGKTGLYLGAIDASGNDGKCVGKLRLRSFQRFSLVSRGVHDADIWMRFAKAQISTSTFNFY